MPDPNTHTAAGLGAAWAAGKVIGLDTDYLVVGLVGALLASARDTPQPALACAGAFLICRLRPLALTVFNLCAVSFFAATVTAIGVLMLPVLQPVGVPVAGLTAFFGAAIIKSITEFITRVWKVGISRLGGSPSDAE